MIGLRRKEGPAGAVCEARVRIVAAARHAFASVGFAGASTREIAKEAGVAQSLLLYHFGSKDALWRAVMDGLAEDLRTRMNAAIAGAPNGTIPQRLMALVRAFIAQCAQDADFHRIMTLEGRQPSERLKWLVERHLRDGFEATCALIRRGQAEGSVRPGDPTLLYYSMIAIAGTAFSLAPEIRLISGNDGAVDPAAIEEMIERVLLVGR